MANMIKKACLECGLFVWHNACASKERSYRCTYCGHPANGGNAGTSKREYAQLVLKKQVARAQGKWSY